MKNIDTINHFERLKDQSKQKLLKVLEWAQRGKELGFDFFDDIQKIQNTIKNIDEEKIKVVLIGGFSEGKTTVAAAWLERVMDNMKIDQSESSDAIEIYRPQGLESKCEIVDTPGLFGFKQKESGLKFEDITKKYISEAHLVLCVLNSVNPLKDSHSEVFRWLFRDLNKLSSTIFVLNKFDDVCDIEDSQEYEESLSIKKGSLIKQLDNFVKLTEEEKANLKVVAISANPYGRGLDTWLKDNSYEEVSKIDTLKEATNKTISENRSKLISNQQLSVVKDVLFNKINDIKLAFEQLNKELAAKKETLNALKVDLTSVEQEIKANLKLLKTELLNYIKGVKSRINGADVTTFGEIFSEEIGKDGIYFNDNLENIYIKYTNLNTAKMEILEKNLSNELDFREKLSDNVMKGMLKQGINGVKMIPVGQMRNFVLAGRNTISSLTGISMKFKPWGAVKFAKGIGGVAAGIGVTMDAWETIQKVRNANKVDKAKKELIDYLDGFEKEIEKNFSGNNVEEFAPAFHDMKTTYEEMVSQDENIFKTKQQIEEWYRTSETIQDITYEDVY